MDKKKGYFYIHLSDPPDLVKNCKCKCNKKIDRNSISCNSCNSWFHIDCIKITNDNF